MPLLKTLPVSFHLILEKNPNSFQAYKADLSSLGSPGHPACGTWRISLHLIPFPWNAMP